MQQCIWTIFNEWAASCCCTLNMHHRANSCTSLARRHSSADNADIRELSLIVSFPGARSCLSPVMPQAAAAFPCMTFSEECSTHPHSLLHILFSDILSNPLAAACFKTATAVSAVYWRLCSWFTKRDTRSWLWLYPFLFTVLVWLHPTAITSDVSGRNLSVRGCISKCMFETRIRGHNWTSSTHRTPWQTDDSTTFLQWMIFSPDKTNLRERKRDWIQKRVGVEVPSWYRACTAAGL